MKLLEQLCAIHAPTGEEHRVRNFILNHVNENSKSWKVKPQIISKGLQDNLILVFGNPKFAVLSHMDSIGFMLSYNNKLLTIGAPSCKNELKLKTSENNITYTAKQDDDYYYLHSNNNLELGTTFSYANSFLESLDKVQSPYLDNRLGIYILLEAARYIENGIIAFTSFEEHFSGGVEKLVKMIYEKYRINQFIINDITSTSVGIKLDEGIVISLRDAVVPRRNFINEIISFCKEKSIQYQLEVEDHGASDGAVVQRSIYPIDWCFVGTAAENMHSNKEIAHKSDIQKLKNFYEELLK